MLSEAGRQPEAAYSAWAHLRKSLFIPDDRMVVVVASQPAEWSAYFDESFGTANAYSVGGYIAPARQWTEFEREWKEFLAIEDMPNLHKSDFENLMGEFKKFRQLPANEQKAKRLRVNQRAIGIIHRRLNAGFAASVIKSDWDALDKRGWGPYLGEKYYGAGARLCLTMVNVWIKRFNYKGPIDFFFEKGAEGAGELAWWLDSIMQDDKLRAAFHMNSWTFADKKDKVLDGILYPGLIPFQAADFIAYETYREMDNRIVEGVKLDKNGKEYPRRGALRYLLQDDDRWAAYQHLDHEQMPTPHFIRYSTKASMEQLLDRLTESAVADGIIPSVGHAA